MASLDSMSVAALEVALKEKLDNLEGLVNRRKKLQEELQTVEGQIAVLGGEAPKRRGRPAGVKNKTTKKASRGGPTGPRPKNKLTMKAAVIKALESSKNGLTLAETAAAVRKLGYKSNSTKFENVVYQCLYNHAEFTKGDNGKYVVKS